MCKWSHSNGSKRICVEWAFCHGIQVQTNRFKASVRIAWFLDFARFIRWQHRGFFCLSLKHSMNTRKVFFSCQLQCCFYLGIPFVFGINRDMLHSLLKLIELLAKVSDFNISNGISSFNFIDNYFRNSKSVAS